jgi:hypothetical protein
MKIIITFDNVIVFPKLKPTFMKEDNVDKVSEIKEKRESGIPGREEVYSKIVRAGNRTYFFDVKATRKNDLYLTITESKKRFNKDGKFFFEKHKIFLYKEDFEKFSNGLEDVVGFITNGKANLEESTEVKDERIKSTNDTEETVSTDEFINVDFEDLGEK